MSEQGGRTFSVQLPTTPSIVSWIDLSVPLFQVPLFYIVYTSRKPQKQSFSTYLLSPWHYFYSSLLSPSTFPNFYISFMTSTLAQNCTCPRFSICNSHEIGKIYLVAKGAKIFKILTLFYNLLLKGLCSIIAVEASTS